MKINALICLLALSLLILPSCNNNTNSVSSSEPTSENISGLTSTQSTAQSENTGEQRFDELSKSFIHPAEVMTFDMETSDPSNDKMFFNFDSEGRVLGCCYPIGDIQVMVSYTYKDDVVRVIAFADEYCVEDRQFRFTNNSSKGFTEFHGYYFKGVTVDTL